MRQRLADMATPGVHVTLGPMAGQRLADMATLGVHVTPTPGLGRAVRQILMDIATVLEVYIRQGTGTAM